MQNVLFALLLLICSAYGYTYEDVVDDSVQESPVHLEPPDFQNFESLDETSLREVIGERIFGRSNGGAVVDLNQDQTLRAGRFEGDIILPANMSIQDYIAKSNALGRNVIRNKWQLWPNGVIPYVLSSRYGEYSKKTIARAMEDYHAKSCVKFVPRTDERDYIYIMPDDGCYSLVGRVGGKQTVSLDAGCIQHGTIIHELLHTSGFFHEQSRADRDEWIDIKWENLLSGTEDQFEKYSLRTIDHLGTQYDYNSIMHYGPYAFSNNPYSPRGKTIIPKKSGGDKIGQRDGFSDIDLQKLNMLYDCADKGPIEERTTKAPTVPNVRPRPRFTTTTTTTAPEAGSQECTDQKSLCFYWSLLKYCTRYPTYMKVNCPKTCKMCETDDSGNDVDDDEPTRAAVRTTASTEEGEEEESETGDQGGSGNCVDLNTNCASWSDKGYCTKFPLYMAKTCKKTCGGSECNTRGAINVRLRPTPQPTAAACADRNVKCPVYARQGYCENHHKGLMRKYCKKSCHFCDEENNL